LSSAAGQSRLLSEVEEAFRSLPDRYLGAEPGFDATYHVRLGDVGHTWEVRLTHHGARVRKGVTRREPDVTIGSDGATWLAMRAGELSGIEAFSRRVLYARGNLDLAVGFEGMFRRPDGRPPLVRMHEARLPGRRVSTLTMGQGPDVLLLHGLGSTKASMFDVAAALSRSYRVHAPDFPGFGSSSKPATAPYSPRYFAETVTALMDELEVDCAHVVGNSMGGRVAIDVAVRWPERTRALALLCPAMAFIRRGLPTALVRLLRPELGLVPHRFRRGTVAAQFWGLFADSDQVDPAMADIAVDEFQRIYASAGARLAFLSAARNIYLEPPFGKRGFYPRLSELESPALFVWGSHDKLVPAAFQRHVTEWLPRAEQIVLEGCGHVPQVERPAQTIGLIERFFARSDALAQPGRLSRAA